MKTEDEGTRILDFGNLCVGFLKKKTITQAASDLGVSRRTLSIIVNWDKC